MAKLLAMLLVTAAFALAGCADDDDGDSNGDSTSTGTGTGGTTATVSGSVSSSLTNTNPPSNATVNKQILDDRFPDANFTIKRGTKVVWTNAGQHPHTVTSATGGFDSSPACTVGTPDECLNNGEKFDFTFNVPGSFAYNCKIHSTTMTGTITVTN